MEKDLATIGVKRIRVWHSWSLIVLTIVLGISTQAFFWGDNFKLLLAAQLFNPDLSIPAIDSAVLADNIYNIFTF